MGTFFVRWSCFQAEQRRIMRRWRRRGVTNPVAEPEWAQFENLHHAQAEMITRQRASQGAATQKR